MISNMGISNSNMGNVIDDISEMGGELNVKNALVTGDASIISNPRLPAANLPWHRRYLAAATLT